MHERDGRIAVLDGLRGLAILLVVMTHSFLTGYRPALVAGPIAVGVEPMVLAGSLGVELFFFLSGFVLFVPFARARLEGRPNPTLAHFFGRRALKILPSYLVALFAIAFFFYQPPWVLENFWRDIFLHLGFVHTFYYTSMFSIASPFWSLGTEVQFYLLFPALAWWMQRQPLFAYGAMLGIGQGFRWWLQHSGNNGNFFWVCQLPAQMDLFAIGMLCAFAYVWLSKRQRLPRWLPNAATCAALVALAFGTWLLNDFSHVTKVGSTADHQAWQNDHRLIVSLTIAVLALGSLFARRWWQRTLANPLLLFLSVISYNLYLWHEAIVVQCSKTGFPCALNADPWRTSRDWGFQYFWMYVIVSIALATLMTFAVERPLLRLRLPELGTGWWRGAAWFRPR